MMRHGDRTRISTCYAYRVEAGPHFVAGLARVVAHSHRNKKEVLRDGGGALECCAAVLTYVDCLRRFCHMFPCVSSSRGPLLRTITCISTITCTNIVVAGGPCRSSARAPLCVMPWAVPRCRTRGGRPTTWRRASAARRTRSPLGHRTCVGREGRVLCAHACTFARVCVCACTCTRVCACACACVCLRACVRVRSSDSCPATLISRPQPPIFPVSRPSFFPVALVRMDRAHTRGNPAK